MSEWFDPDQSTAREQSRHCRGERRPRAGTASIDMAVGALVLLPAAMLRDYGVFLAGLFVLGTGLTILQTACSSSITRSSGTGSTGGDGARSLDAGLIVADRGRIKELEPVALFRGR